MKNPISLDKPFTDLIVEKNNDKTSLNFQQEINAIAGPLFQVWYLFVDMVMVGRKELIAVLQDDYHQMTKERWGEAIFQEIYAVKDYISNYENKIGENHKTTASARRNNLYFKQIVQSVENTKMYPTPDAHPILFEEISVLGTQEDVNISIHY